MAKKIALAFVIVLLVLIAVIATRPGEFRIERATTVSAPAALIFPHIANLHNWSAWSPWEKLDPSMKKTFEGPDYGTGAIYAWVGNDAVGEGRMTVMDVQAPQSVSIKLDFIKPWTATNTALFTLGSPTPESTVVTWAMEGQNNFMAKAFSMFVDVDKLVGKDFEEGLAQLKSVCEAEAQKAAKPAAPPAPPPAEPTTPATATPKMLPANHAKGH